MKNIKTRRITNIDLEVDSNLREVITRNENGVDFKYYPFEFVADKPVHVRWHWHEAVEFIYVEEGEMLISIAEEQIKLEAGNIVFLNSGTLHCGDAIRGKGCKFCSIVFDYAKIMRAEKDEMLQSYIDKVVGQTDVKYILLTEEDSVYQQFLAVMKLIPEIVTEKEAYYEFACALIAGRLWLYIMRYLERKNERVKERPAQRVLDEARVKKALRFIEDHYGEGITLDEIAQSVHVSNSECCRCFKRSLDMTPFEYLMRFRVYRTTEIMMDNKSMSVAEIAAEAGFHSSSYFNKLFKKYMDCTPTEFRKNPDAYHWNRDNFMIPMY